jgi:hypothetical protein
MLLSIWLNFRDRPHPKSIPARKPARVLIGYVRWDYGGIFDPARARRAAACAKCVDIALCPCYDGLSRRAPARRCRAGGLHMSEPRLSVRDRYVQAVHARLRMQHPLSFHLGLGR